LDIVIHIGWHKTGTTAIQWFLLMNKAELITKLNTYYPDEGLLTCAHHTIAWTFQNRKSSPWGAVPVVAGGGSSYVRAAVNSAKAQNCSRVIFSSEDFCRFKRNEVRLLRQALNQPGNSTKIIAYIRRQDLFNESAYNMGVKWWGSRLKMDFSDYIKDKGAFPNYHHKLAAWSDIFGAENVTVRGYDRASLDMNDIRIDFCNAIGIDSTALRLAEQSSNDSLGPTTLEFLRILNSLDIPREKHDRIASRLLDFDASHHAPKAVLFDPEQRRLFMAPFGETNEYLQQFGIQTDALALGAKPMPTQNIRKLTLDEFRELLDCISG
jgi:hypothetical protein